ncbi:protein kinase domain-containing protein [Pseudoteredinibacter isoporae]|uniref:protein kinase domain-containing protein n=1 Tax=Pseudoteredinibacter isoporae TaxID=570281 RepID=UPI003107A9DA
MKYPELPQKIAHYKILAVLGRGGMGIVYLAEDSRLRRQVAIKCLYKQQSDILVKRLRREAKVLATLNHPNVVHLYDVVEGEQGFALVMEHVKGNSLDQHLRENSLSEQDKLALLGQILEGLAAAHREGIVHRDLKLENILIDANGRAKISDFGIAKYHHGNTIELSQHQNPSGSLSAMSPEQIRGERLSPASDVFSFGLLAWQILQGHHPFEGKTDLVRVEKILNEPAPSLNLEAFPAGFVQSMDAALKKESEDRPKNADALISLLKHYLPIKNILVSDFASDSTVDDNQKNLLTFRRMCITAIIFALVSLLIVCGKLSGWFYPESKPVYVAILPTAIKFKDEFDYEDIQQTVYYALQDGIIDLSGSNLIPRREVESYEGESNQMTMALGADVVIRSDLVCYELKCDLTLTLSEDKGQIKSKKLSIIEDRLLEVHRITQLKLAELFPNRKGLDPLSEVINEEDYKEYIKLVQIARENESHHADIFRKLRVLLDKAPKFGPLYRLYTKIGLDLFSETKDNYFAEQVKQVLESSDQSRLSDKDVRLLWVEAHAELGELDLALSKIQQIEKIYLEDRQTKSLRGLIEESRENYELAIRYYQEANDMRFSVRTYRDIAINYWFLGDVKKAIFALEKALALNPKDIHAGLTLATFHMTSGNLDKAEDMFLSLEEKSKITSTYDNLGLLYMLKRDYKRAEQYFVKTSRISSDSRFWSLNLADTYALQGEDKKAREHYLLALKRLSNSSHSGELGAIAQAYIHLGESKKALAALKQAKEIAPDNSDIIYAEAIIYSKLEDYPSALIAIERSIFLGLGKIWYSLPWFDALCKHEKYGIEFRRLTDQSCLE